MVENKALQKVLVGSAIVNLGSFYFVGVPSAVVLGFVIIHMKGKGLWLGIVSAFMMQVKIFAVITIKASWEKEATKAARRVKSSRVPPREGVEGAKDTLENEI
ncbi:hypothetical protein V8G54_012003 [Vigna mungo]|uniref:Uncharacterized protein n=1 Tax=Vigna mungo TaxID=3915 RepID=A0AAQ3NTC8_VIGMU